MRIVYFDLDSLRPDHLGCYGYDRPTSPNIDRIAARGMCFDRYYCSSSPCVPSRTAMCSGRFGIRNGVLSNFGPGAEFRIEQKKYGGPVPEQEFYPRTLFRHGLDPICFSNFADRHQSLWFMAGWREFHTINLRGGAETADEVNATVLPWLQANDGRDDYYLHINYWDAHRVYKMDPTWADRFADHPVTQAWPDAAAIAEHQDVTGLFTAHRQFRDDQSHVPLMPGAINNRADFEHMITGYDAAIAMVDHHVGQVLDELERQGVLDETVIIISADHGDSFGEHGVYSDHVNVAESIHHVPLIIQWPGVTEPGSRCDALLYHLDLPPTVCEMLGADIPSNWDGQSFAHHLRGETGPERDHLVWDSGLYTVQRAVRSRSHLYIHTYHAHGYNNWPDEALYDMDADPYETTNLADSQPELLATMRGRMDAWVAEQLAKDPGAEDPLQLILQDRASGAKLSM